MTDSTGGKLKSNDVALLNGPTEAGEVRPVEEGKPLASDGELVKLTPRAEASNLCDVEVVHQTATVPPSRKQGHGPARVGNDTYRKNWNQVFARRGDKVTSAHEKARPAPKRKTDYSLN
jgi:hypothetical protein